MSFSLNFQDINLTKYFIDLNIKKLELIKTNIKDIKICFNNILNSNAFINELIDINDKIENFLNFFQTINNSSKTNNKEKYIELYKTLKEKFDNYFGKNINQYIQKIYELNEKIRKSLQDMIEFSPPSIYNNSESSINFNLEMEASCEENYYKENNSKYSNLYKEEKNYIIFNEEDNEIKCDRHSEEKGVFYCDLCQGIFCKKCEKDFLLNLTEEHNLKEIDDLIAKNEKEKCEFIKSTTNLFKEFILKCNFIIDNKNDKFINMFIKQKFEYPKIKRENEHIFEYQTEFLKKINECEKILIESNETQISINNNTLTDNFSKKLINNLNDILGEWELVDRNTFQKIDKDYEDQYIINEKCEKNKDGTIVNNEPDEDEDEEDEGLNGDNEEEDNVNIYALLNRKFKNIVKIINKNKNKSNFVIETILNNMIKTICKVLRIDKSRIFLLFKDKRAFINHFIKSEEFEKMSPKNIRLNYKNINFLYQYKLIIDYFLIKQCKIPKKYINYKYNFITPNLSLNIIRGTEIYNPPFGWFGVGLDVKEKFDINDDNWLNKNDISSEWANAYLFLPNKLKFDELVKMLYDIIVYNKLNLDKQFQIKFHNYNKRVIDKKQKIGTGYYLTPNIDIAEKYTSYIIFNKKKYKIVLMAKVLIKSIKEPDDGDFWIFQEKNIKDIRVYKILFKEIF